MKFSVESKKIATMHAYQETEQECHVNSLKKNHKDTEWDDKVVQSKDYGEECKFIEMGVGLTEELSIFHSEPMQDTSSQERRAMCLKLVQYLIWWFGSVITFTLPQYAL